MWFRTPENAWSSSYADRCWAATWPGTTGGSSTAPATRMPSRLLQRGEMLLGDRDLSVITARGKSDETAERSARFVLVPQLFEHEAEVEVCTHVARIHLDGAAQRLEGLLEAAKVRQGLAEVEQQRWIVRVGVDGVPAREDGLIHHVARFIHLRQVHVRHVQAEVVGDRLTIEVHGLVEAAGPLLQVGQDVAEFVGAERELHQPILAHGLERPIHQL